MLMTVGKYHEYETLFNNSEDKSAFFDKYFDPEAIFIHPFKGTFRGKKELVEFWNAGEGSGHEGIHEIIKMTNLVSEEDKFAVELDIEWCCFKDADYLGPRKKDDIFYGKCSAFYKIRNEKICYVQIYLNLANRL